jgi:Nickel responsive protein SCO4226-like
VELVLVERRFDQPVKFEDIQRLEDEGSWCLDAHNVRFLKTLFSRDRRRMLCLYEAPDAESVRLAEDQARVPFDRAWTCTHLQSTSPIAAPAAAEYVVVERAFPTPVTAEFVSDALKRAGWCLDLYCATYLESYLGGEGTKMVCVFRAPDAEAVRLANIKAEVPYTDVWTASIHVPGK